MLPDRALNVAHAVLEQHVFDGDVVIDATCGRGHDTVKLAELVGPTGKVFAIDIQETAVSSTRDRLSENNLHSRVVLSLADHANLAQIIPSELSGKVAAVCFNLGYLPGSDKRLVTESNTTREALLQAVDIIRPGGVLVIVVYTGHEGGREEASTVEAVASILDQAHYSAYLYKNLNQVNNPPHVVIIKRRVS